MAMHHKPCSRILKYLIFFVFTLGCKNRQDNSNLSDTFLGFQLNTKKEQVLKHIDSLKVMKKIVELSDKNDSIVNIRRFSFPMYVLDDSVQGYFLLQFGNNRNFFHDKLFKITYSLSFLGNYDSVWKSYRKVEDLYFYKYGAPADTVEDNCVGHYSDYVWKKGGMNINSFLKLHKRTKMPPGSSSALSEDFVKKTDPINLLNDYSLSVSYEYVFPSVQKQITNQHMQSQENIDNNKKEKKRQRLDSLSKVI